VIASEVTTIWRYTNVYIIIIIIICLYKCIRAVWFETGLIRLSLVLDQTLVLNFDLSGKFGFRLWS